MLMRCCAFALLTVKMRQRTHKHIHMLNSYSTIDGLTYEYCVRFLRLSSHSLLCLVHSNMKWNRKDKKSNERKKTHKTVGGKIDDCNHRANQFCDSHRRALRFARALEHIYTHRAHINMMINNRIFIEQLHAHKSVCSQRQTVRWDFRFCSYHLLFAVRCQCACALYGLCVYVCVPAEPNNH